MKETINNLVDDRAIVPVAEVHLINVLVDSATMLAKTSHSVSSMPEDENDEAGIILLKKYNHTFTYQGGDVFVEGMAALQELFAPKEVETPIEE